MSAFPARQRRLVRELRSLARELPLYWGSTIAVRMDEERPHLLKVGVEGMHTEHGKPQTSKQGLLCARTESRNARSMG